MACDGFADFYARYHRRLRAVAICAYGRAEADDLAQEAMTRACASYARLDAERDPWPWLVTILRNVARTRFAERRPVPLATLPGSVEDAAGAVEERAVVRAALRRLSPADRAALVLRECHDYSFEELAALLGRSPNTVRQQVFRARKRLAAAYTAVGGRAVAVAWWARRWRLATPAPGHAAAAVVAGVVLAGTPAAGPAAAERPVARAAAGPAARGGTQARPAALRAAPARPLQPARAARPAAPREAARPGPGGATPAAPGPASFAPAPERHGLEAASAGTASEPRRSAGDGYLCALTELC